MENNDTSSEFAGLQTIEFQFEEIPEKQLTYSTDRRKVFVVHGRNDKARRALFSFLRAIGLDPIEWEEAVHMTGEGSPFIGKILDDAFSNSQAAIILLTGDDLAMLQKEFWLNHDPGYEKELTPQARPNVLFEAGMAFGRYPERTIIVSLGALRPFSDIAGRNIMHLSNSAATRHSFAGRLRKAGCDVKIDGRSDWLSPETANFEVIHPSEKENSAVIQNPPAVQRTTTIAEEINSPLAVEKSNTPIISTSEHLLIFGSIDECETHIFFHQNGAIRGFLARVHNSKDVPISNFVFRVLQIESYDQQNKRYRKSSDPKTAVESRPDIVDPGHPSKNLWIIRTDNNPQNQGKFIIGGDPMNLISWPPIDLSEIQQWRFTVDASAQTTDPNAPNKKVPIRLIDKTQITIEWNKSEDTFSIKPIN
jgi:predicted nucleotide-binding protein